MERAEWLLAGNGSFGCASLPTGAFCVDLYKGIQFRIQSLNPVEMRFQQFNRRQFLCAHLLSHSHG
jgi:hypothetical protein